MCSLSAVDYLQSLLKFSLVVVYYRQIFKTIRYPYDVVVVCHDNRLSLHQDAKIEIFGLNSIKIIAFNIDLKLLLNVSIKFYDREGGMVRSLFGTGNIYSSIVSQRSHCLLIATFRPLIASLFKTGQDGQSKRCHQHPVTFKDKVERFLELFVVMATGYDQNGSHIADDKTQVRLKSMEHAILKRH